MFEFIALAQQCAPAVAHQTLAAIVKTESGFRPLAIGINGGAKLARQPATKDEAVATAKWLISNGYNIDMGLGQINSANLQWLNVAVDDVFDPCINLAAAAKILLGNYQTASKKHPTDQAALQAALSAYNTGSFSRGFQNGYVQKVVNNANTVVPVIGANPIPLTLKKGGSAQVIKPASNASTAGAAKLQVDNPKPASESEPSTNVYGNSPSKVMVY